MSMETMRSPSLSVMAEGPAAVRDMTRRLSQVKRRSRPNAVPTMMSSSSLQRRTQPILSPSLSFVKISPPLLILSKAWSGVRLIAPLFVKTTMLNELSVKLAALTAKTPDKVVFSAMPANNAGRAAPRAVRVVMGTSKARMPKAKASSEMHIKVSWSLHEATCSTTPSALFFGVPALPLDPRPCVVKSPTAMRFINPVRDTVTMLRAFSIVS
mmetsp:Transcript_8829/g.29132  ORF Transcript_8829/g.29132 Transcript_8829/m.29132 type:complete len:212 (-) Transcript_8829:1856-2491(-)